MGLQITTMGRGPADDPPFFAAASAAATVAAEALPSDGHGCGPQHPGAS
jgi:hypothetical protein